MIDSSQNPGWNASEILAQFARPSFNCVALEAWRQDHFNQGQTIWID